MRNLKKYIVPAAIGFVLSFLISLFATKGNFGRALLRGLIFAIVFAALFFLIDFVFNKFLDGTDNSSAPKKKTEPGVGDRIDITLSDEELSDDGEDLKFFVGQNKVGLNQSATDISRPNEKGFESVTESKDEPKFQNLTAAKDTVVPAATSQPVSSAKSVAAESSVASENAFRPVPLGTPEKSEAPETVEQGNSKISDLDALPDISDFDSELGSNEGLEGETAEEPLNDTDFTGSNKSLYNRKKPGDEVSSGHDAATLAKAIQTILKREE